MPKFVRVTDNLTGHEYTVTAALAASDEKRYKLIKDAPAVNRAGRPLPPTANPKAAKGSAPDAPPAK